MTRWTPRTWTVAFATLLVGFGLARAGDNAPQAVRNVPEWNVGKAKVASPITTEITAAGPFYYTCHFLRD